jgi:hypothetical protein
MLAWAAARRGDTLAKASGVRRMDLRERVVIG